MGSDNLNTILARIKLFNPKEKDTLIDKIKAFAYLYPTKIYKLIACLDTTNIDNELFYVLQKGLPHSHSLQVLETAMQILPKHKNNWQWVRPILAQIEADKWHSPDIILALQNIYATSNNYLVKQNILLALASIVDYLLPSNKKNSKTLYHWIYSKLNFADTDYIIQSLLVLSNTNNENSFKKIMQYTNSKNEEINYYVNQILHNNSFLNEYVKAKKNK